jgi:hypothetical protein
MEPDTAAKARFDEVERKVEAKAEPEAKELAGTIARQVKDDYYASRWYFLADHWLKGK